MKMSIVQRMKVWFSKSKEFSVMEMMAMDDEELGAKYCECAGSSCKISLLGAKKVPIGIPWELKWNYVRNDIAPNFYNLLADIIRQNFFNYDDNEIGRLLKILLPVYSMKKENITFSKENYTSLETKLHLDEQVQEFHDDVVANFSTKKIQAQAENDKKRIDSLTEDICRIKNSKKEQKKILNNSTDYMRLKNAARKLDESNASLVNTISKH